MHHDQIVRIAPVGDGVGQGQGLRLLDTVELEQSGQGFRVGGVEIEPAGFVVYPQGDPDALEVEMIGASVGQHASLRIDLTHAHHGQFGAGFGGQARLRQ